MIGRHEHDRASELLGLVELLQQASELAIDERHLAIVQRRPEAVRDIGRRFVRRVRIVVVQPEEPARRLSAGSRRKPLERCVGAGVRRTLDVRRSTGIVPAREVVLVLLEPAIESEPAIERKARHDGPRSVARLPEVLRGRLDSGSQHESAVVAKPVAERRQPGEDRCVRWAGQRRVRNRGLEAHATRGQRVQRRSGGGLVSVRTDTIGSQRVDRHEQYVRRIGGACSAGVGRTAGDRPSSA